MATDREIIKGLQKGEYGSSGLADVSAAVQKMHRTVFTHTVDNSGNAAANRAKEPIVMDDVGAGKVISAKLVPSVDVVNNDLNFLTFTVAKQTANGTSTTIASGNTAVTGGLGNIFAFVPVALTLTANAVEYAAGDTLTWQMTATNNGKAVCAANAAAKLVVVAERI